MKRISLNDYNSSLGTLIDLSHPLDYLENHDKRAVNIPYNTLMLHYKDYLDKNKRYYITCKKGIHSRKAVAMLEYLGYDVTQVYHD